MENQVKGTAKNRILAAVAAAVVVFIALLLFMNANSARISEQNAKYLEGTTEQTARRINDLLDTSLGIIQSAATVYENNLKSDVINPYDVVENINVSSFDYTFFTDAEGIAFRNDGLVENVQDKEYYKLGIEGESGICAVASAAFEEQNIMVFYAPVMHEGTVLGVVAGVYREYTLSDYMTTAFFGVSTPTFLCSPDGMVVASSVGASSSADNIVTLYDEERFNDISLEEFDHNLKEGIATGFTYRSDAGYGSAYMTKLANFDWMILRTFPEAITNSMLESANSAGFILVAGVILAAVIVIIVLLVQSRRRQQVLLLERQEATRIVDASTNLFNSLLEVNLIDDTYQYLKAERAIANVANRGSFAELREKVGASTVEDDKEIVFNSLDPAKIREALTADVPFCQFEYRISSESGEDIWLQASVLCLARDKAGRPTNLLITVQDVTDVKSREIASRIALEEAFRAAEYASQAKSDFLNSMSHDIRTPMNSIMGMTAIASMHVDEPERVRECLANITSASHHLLGLINEVLDMAKIESGNISLSEENFEISEMIENLMTIVHPQVDAKHQDLRTELVGIKHENVIGDPTRLQQVFVNIMGNAVKFTPEGGCITLRITELESRVHGSGCYEFKFTDTGCGMSPEFLKTIFEPFTRANDSRVTKVEGTGLGMSIVKSVVSLMNGTIDVESELGVGTTFTVTVQLKLRDADDGDLSDIEGARVLVVDDEEHTCIASCEMLADIGMESEYTLSGQAGIDAVVRAQESGNPFKAVILDWKMPGMSGVQAAKIIREKTKGEMPIIILSGYDWSMIENEAREAGVDAFIMKPLFRSRLIKVMRELLSGYVEAPLNQAAVLEECAFDDRRILLTEDNSMAAEIAKEIIGMTGAQVDHAENGKVAVDMLLGSEPGRYDLVLMDIQMPVMNGYEATAAIRAAADTRPDLGSIPIVALSADAFAEDMKRAQSVGMNAHMAKPLEIDPLVSMLRKWIPSKDNQNQGTD